MPGAPMSIFISYSRRNSSFVDQLEAHLKAYDFDTRVDRRKIEDSQSWKKALKDAIDRCNVVLVILSPSSGTSPYVQMEYQYALNTGKSVILLEYQTCPDIPALRNIQRVSYSTNTEQGLSDLLIALNSLEIEPLARSNHKQLRSDHIEYFRIQALSAQEEGKWRQAAGFWQALLAIEPQRSEARQSLEQCLRLQGQRASASGGWEQAMSIWEALLKLKPDDPQAARQLALAKFNYGYAQYYKDAQQFIAENALSPARTQLGLLWEYAPYYGDPDKLSLKVDMTKPPGSPAIFDKEEEEKLANEQREALALAQLAREQREREARAAIELEQRVKAQREKEVLERRSSNAIEGPERFSPTLIELDNTRAYQPTFDYLTDVPELERRSSDEQEKEAEQARKRLPSWFIQDELGTTPSVVWYSLFFLLTGLGCAVAIVTQSIPQALGAIGITALLAYLLGYHRTIHRMPKRVPDRIKQNSWEDSIPAQRDDDSYSIVLSITVPLLIIAICSLITLFFVDQVSLLRYSTQLTSHFLWFSYPWWLGRQIEAGLLIGATLSLVTFLISWFKPQKKKLGLALRKALTWGVLWGFLCLLICSWLGPIFDWGFGFGSEWSFSLLGFVVGAIGGAGLGSSFAICMKDRPLPGSPDSSEFGTFIAEEK